MNRYSIVYSQQAYDDIEALYYVIIAEYKTYITAERYVIGLENAIKELSNKAESFAIQNSDYFKQFGNCARRINYKKMTIIYSISDNKVVIQRVIPESLIIE